MKEEVVLHGRWVSPYQVRVALALKLKGIPYSYVEEDLQSKSPELLRYNPIYKKVPVLVHNRKPIVESLVILEYLEDTWKDAPLLPQDPYLRSRVRFWAHFYDTTYSQTSKQALFARGEARQKAMKELQGLINTLEASLWKDFQGGTPYLNGERPGFLDIILGTGGCYIKAIEEACGETLVDPQSSPSYQELLNKLKEHPLVKETLPPHEKLVQYFKLVREIVLKSSHD